MNFSHSPSRAVAEELIGLNGESPEPVNQERIGDRGDDIREAGEPTNPLGDPPLSELIGDAVATLESNKAQAAEAFSKDGFCR